MVIPDLAVGAVAVPTKISIRNRFHRKVLETTQQSIVLRHFDLLAQHLDCYQFFEGIKEILFGRLWWFDRLETGLGHARSIAFPDRNNKTLLGQGNLEC